MNLTDVASGYNLAKINANFQEVERVVNEELLHRVNEDSLPNSLQTDVDANSRRIYNLPTPSSGGEPLRLKDLFGSPDELIGGPQLETVEAIDGQTEFTLLTSYVPGTNSMYVFRNGILLAPDEFVEVSPTAVTLVTPVDFGDIITFAPVAVNTGTGSGEATTGANLGAGAGVYKQKVGNTLQFKTVVAGSNISLTEGADTLTIAATGSASGEANTGSNVGTGYGVFANKTGVDLRFKSINQGSGITVSSDGSTITVANSAPAVAYSASNVGATGEGVFSGTVGTEHQFKKLKAGTNVTLTSDATSVTIAASGGGSSNLGLTNVKDYGAVGDGSTDDSAAFNSALAAINTGVGGTLWIPPGKYRLNSTISSTLATSTSLHIMGAGAEVSVLYFANNSGITVTCVEGGYWTKNPSGNSVSISGLAITAGLEATGTAFTVVGNTVTGRPVPPINVNNVVIRGDIPNNSWSNGLYFNKAHAATVSHYNWFGKIVTAVGNAILIDADSTHNVSEFRFSNCGITYAGKGVSAGAYVEGIHLTNVDMVFVEKGVEWLCGGSDESELGMANCHIAATLYCVHMQSLVDSHISNSLFFPSGSPVTWNGVRMDKSAATISNCFFGGASQASNVGIVNTNLVTGDANWSLNHPTTIVNNSFRAMPTGISLGTNTGNVFVGASNQYSSDVTTRINSSNAHSLIEKRVYSGTVVINLAGGSTSETVAVSIPTNTFKTAAEGGFLVLAQNAEDLIGFYLYDSSTSSSAQFLVKRRDGAALPTGTRRFSYSLSGI